MKQRLGIAIALLGNPELLVLDEPINGLDPAGIKEIRDLMLKLNQEKGVTLIISSHLLDELGKVATRYGIINAGELVEEISAEELQERCKTCLNIVTPDVKKAEEVLEKNGLLHNHKSTDEKISLYEHVDNPSAINEILVQAGVRVNELSFSGSGFEDYFIERLGK